MPMPPRLEVMKFRLAAKEHTEKKADAADEQSKDPDSESPPIAQRWRDMLATTVAIRNKVNGRYVERPQSSKTTTNGKSNTLSMIFRKVKWRVGTMR